MRTTGGGGAETLPEHRRSKRVDIAVLVTLVALSLIMTSSANRLAGAALARHAPWAAWTASAAMPSCLVIATIFLALGDLRLLRWPSLSPADRVYAARLAAIWLCAWLAGLIAVALATGGWITYAKGPATILAFLVFGPIGEELLFRGLIYERARRVWRRSTNPAVAVSALAFSMHHLQLHPFPPRGIALAQLAFTLPLGVVLTKLRERSGSLWPSLLLHVATNLPAAV